MRRVARGSQPQTVFTCAEIGAFLAILYLNIVLPGNRHPDDQ
jgi:hypothetical protein